jgi:hypothetical protein
MATDNITARRDKNDVPSLLGVSNVDEETTVPIYADPILHAIIFHEV